MAVLLDPDRTIVHSRYMRDLSNERDTFGNLNKADLQAAINAIDDWSNANQASFNAAIPLPARTALTAPQKARLFAAILLKRYEKGV